MTRVIEIAFSFYVVDVQKFNIFFTEEKNPKNEGTKQTINLRIKFEFQLCNYSQDSLIKFKLGIIYTPNCS